MMKTNNKNDSVLVIGADLKGIDASLDLADSGFRVYLLDYESRESAQSPPSGYAEDEDAERLLIDKNEKAPMSASLPLVPPKAIKAGMHPDIEFLTSSEILSVDGQSGDLIIAIKKRSQFADEQNRTLSLAPDERVEAHPTMTSRKECGGFASLSERRPSGFPQSRAFPDVRINGEPLDRNECAPCVQACPANVNAPDYMALIAQKKYDEARELIMERMPLPGIIGRICPHPCETACTRNAFDEPLAICALKRFVSDMSNAPKPPEIKKKKEKVAIIGSGPAGLSAAYYIAKEGYNVTIFEALPVVGGMLYTRIPEYRLPRDIIAKDVAAITALGVTIKTNTPIDEHYSVDDLLNDGYKAIFIATGAHEGLKLGLPHDTARGVICGEKFLRKHNMGRDFIPGKKVAVIGGGNVAIDSARTAVRLGADEVTILYRRSRSEMPASAWEVREAEKEGITIRFLTAPAKILMKEGKVCGLECVRMKLGDADERGRRAPIQIKGSEYTIDIDTLVVAVGQKPKSDYLGARSGIDVDERGIIKVDAVTRATSRAGVFAGGDAVNGPSTAVEAVTAGREAAISIIRYLEHKDIAADRKRQTTCIMPSENPYMDDEPEPKPRVEMKTLLPRDRTRDFSEVERGFTEAQALEEASRCLNCGYASVESVRRSAVCKAAIDAFAPQDEIITINVGSIIVSPGLKNFDADMLEKLQGKNGGA